MSSCETSQIKYIGDGTTTIYTFPFEYMKKSDIEVLILNQATNVYENIPKTDPTYGWQLANATTIQFNTAPPSGTNFLIARNTDVNELSAEFFPGSAIRAKDLNANFEQLQFAVEEDRCNMSSIDVGTSGTVAVGTTTTGEPGTDALVSNVGEPTAAILDFTIPRGDVGPQGPAGLGVTFKGGIDATTESAPLNPSDGDLWYNTVSGTVTSGWGSITGEPININDRLIYNGTEWIILPTTADGLWEESNDVLSPVNTSSKVTSAVTSSSDPSNTLVTKSYVDSIPAGGVTKIVAGNNVTISPSSGTGVVTVNSTGGGGGGGGTTKADIYGTAKAWGTVDGVTATLKNGKNCTVARNGSNIGRYIVTFDTPITGEYTVTTGNESSRGLVAVQLKTSTGFELTGLDESAGDFANLSNIQFAVFDDEPAEIIVGSGTVANTNIYGTLKASAHCVWSELGASGSPAMTGVYGSLGIQSVEQSGSNTAKITFTPGLFDDENYSVTCITKYGGTATAWLNYEFQQRTKDYFIVTFSSEAGGLPPFGFDIQVSDNKPAEISLTTFGDVINYSGAAAWASVAADGTLENGLNISSISTFGVSGYRVVFTTPMPDSNYAVTFGAANLQAIIPDTKTATGFDYQTYEVTGNANLTENNFVVNATNALPPKGGTGTDSWATVDLTTAMGPCNVPASFNVASVTRTGLGEYDVVFTTPMPSNDYGVVGTIDGGAGGTAVLLSCYNKSSTGFTVYSYGTNIDQAIDRAFSFTVNATNATLPTSFTEEEIQAVVDLAKSGSANGASAWGHIDGNNTILGGINVASVTGTTVRAVTFTTPMPNGNYSVVATSISSYTGNRIVSQDATGFSYSVINSAGNAEASQPFNFAVFSSNVSLPLTVTQAEIDTFKATAAALPTAATRIATLEDSIPDVSGFINSSYLEQRIGSITVPQLPADLITASELETRIAGIPYPNLTPYALKTELPVVPPSPDLTPYATTTYVETRIAGLPVPTVTQQDIALAATTVDAKFDMLRSAIQESTDFSTLKARLLAVLQ